MTRVGVAALGAWVTGERSSYGPPMSFQSPRRIDSAQAATSEVRWNERNSATTEIATEAEKRSVWVTAQPAMYPP